MLVQFMSLESSCFKFGPSSSPTEQEKKSDLEKHDLKIKNDLIYYWLCFTTAFDNNKIELRDSTLENVKKWLHPRSLSNQAHKISCLYNNTYFVVFSKNCVDQSSMPLYLAWINHLYILNWLNRINFGKKPLIKEIVEIRGCVLNWNSKWTRFLTKEIYKGEN